MDNITYYIKDEFGTIRASREDPDAAYRFMRMNYPSGSVIAQGVE